MKNKKAIISALIIISIIAAFFIIINTIWGPKYGFFAEKLEEEPNSYVNISENQMQQFPHLKEAILNNGTAETPYEELDEVRNFLDDKDTRNIKYQNEYYKIRFVYSEGV